MDAEIGTIYHWIWKASFGPKSVEEPHTGWSGFVKIVTGKRRVIHNDLKIQTVDEFIKELSRNFFQKLVNHTNPTLLDQLNYTHNNGKYAFPYATTKWSTPLKPP
ncbi:hypothetical protein AVEN_202792-1 [Araneus ventricosus]|uniref:Uncharacterized protein n=1 Tax=Araneus ventricosus TaxID=182803 RepID=A0A4Y2TBY6_ARAVE|nr:hypothetical protein AVEN_202792-1 [Araneus ventricosus]